MPFPIIERAIYSFRFLYDELMENQLHDRMHSRVNSLIVKVLHVQRASSTHAMCQSLIYTAWSEF